MLNSEKAFDNNGKEEFVKRIFKIQSEIVYKLFI